MAGDYTRFTFKADKNYSQVRQQQGRVSLDADWNEGEAIDDRHWRSETFDMLGRSVVPATTPLAFEIVPVAPGDFTIGVGRLYLDGIQLENHGLLPQFDAVLEELHGTAAIPYAAPPGNPVQPFYPTAPALTLPVAGRSDLVYLHAWQREVTALEDPGLLDVALGGPDTTTRMQSAWQVQVLEGVGDLHCPDESDAWNDLIEPSAGRLSSDATAPGDDKPCIISPSGGYKGLENRLYRVEIHTPGALGTAKFKWSRDNVSVRAAVDAISAGLDQITVRELGRDQVLRFNVGDWVEVMDDQLEFRIRAGENLSGHMAKITAIDEANAILTIDPQIDGGLGFDATDSDRHTRVQRWDQSAGVDANGLLDTAAGPLELGNDGVLVWFSIDPANPTGEFKRGDFWVFSARTADASVEKLEAAPPRGVHHHYCRLAVVHWGDSVETTQVHDCRTIWPPAQCCTIAVRPGEDIQAAIDKVPADGGCVCLLPGLHRIHQPLLIDKRQNLSFKGVGPASKLIYESIDTQIDHQAALYLVGGSRDIHISDLLIYADTLPELVAVDEESRDIRIEGCQLINAALKAGETSPCCLLLGHCCEVRIGESRLLGMVDVAQATAAQLAQIDSELAALRPVLADDVMAAPPEPEPRPVVPVKHLRVDANACYFNRAGLFLIDALEGRVNDNEFHVLESSELEPFVRPASPAAGDEFVEPFDPLKFYGGLDDLFAQLTPCAPTSPSQRKGVGLDGEASVIGSKENAAIWGVMLHHYRIVGNTMNAMYGIVANACRDLHTGNNRIAAQTAGVLLGYAFDAEVRDSDIEIVIRDKSLDESPPLTLQKAWKSRFYSSSTAVAVFFTRGFRVCNNRLDAHTGVCATKQFDTPVEADSLPRESVLRVLGIGRLWRVSLELVWFFYQLFSLLSGKPVTPPAPGEASPREKFEQRMFQGLITQLGGRLFTYFVGKTEISDNRMQVTRYGVLFNKILSIGGIRILRNRIGGHRLGAIHLHPWFSVGRVDDYAKWTRCLLEWLLKMLFLFRDALRNFLDNSSAGDTTGNGLVGGVTVGISWVLVLCSRYCGGQTSGDGDGDGDGTTEPTPVEKLLDSLDEFLDNLDPTWLDDLVNQAYVIDGNVLAGAGDGIVTGLDGTRISHNQISVWPANTVPYEVVVFGLRFKAQFQGSVAAVSPYYTGGVEMFTESALQADRDMLFLSAMGAQGWVIEADDSGNSFWSQSDYRNGFRAFLASWSTYVNNDSPLVPHIQSMFEGLNESSLDQAKVQEGWIGALTTMVWELKGYGILMLGSDMDCHHNRVESWTGCGSEFLNSVFWGQKEFATTEGANVNDFSNIGVRSAHRPILFASPGLGGIWQYSNFLSWSKDLLLLMLGDKGRDTNYHLVLALLFYYVLFLSKQRSQRVNENHVESPLVHGIRTMNLYGSDETEVMDNLVRNASRHGIYHFKAPLVTLRGSVTIKVHRNTVLHSTGSSAFRNVPGREWDFASLIWVESGDIYGDRQEEGYGTTLLSLNHGDGEGLESFGNVEGEGLGSTAVYVETSVASVTNNHILGNADYAFSIQANKGLFTDNVTDKGHDLLNPAIDQGPNVIL